MGMNLRRPDIRTAEDYLLVSDFLTLLTKHPGVYQNVELRGNSLICVQYRSWLWQVLLNRRVDDAKHVGLGFAVICARNKSHIYYAKCKYYVWNIKPKQSCANTNTPKLTNNECQLRIHVESAESIPAKTPRTHIHILCTHQWRRWIWMIYEEMPYENLIRNLPCNA